MRVFLDELLIDETATTLRAALTAASERAGSRLLVEATADGRPIPSQDLTAPPETNPYADEIRFMSADSALLIQAALYDAADMLENASASQAAAARMVQQGDLESALKEVGGIVECWSRVQQVIGLVAQAREAGLDGSGADATFSGGLPGMIKELTVGLSEMKRAVQAQDWAALADVLAFDLEEQAGRWRSWFGDLAQRSR